MGAKIHPAPSVEVADVLKIFLHFAERGVGKHRDGEYPRCRHLNDCRAERLSIFNEDRIHLRNRAVARMRLPTD